MEQAGVFESIGGWGTVVAVVIFDASTKGNELYRDSTYVPLDGDVTALAELSERISAALKRIAEVWTKTR